MSFEDKIKYVELWQTQSKQLWSRLQTATVLHSAVLAGWYKLNKDDEATWLLLLLGIAFSVLIILLMVRDTQYLDSMKMKSADAFPETNKRLSGRLCGYIMVGILGLAELGLLLHEIGCCSN